MHTDLAAWFSENYVCLNAENTSAQGTLIRKMILVPSFQVVGDASKYKGTGWAYCIPNIMGHLPSRATQQWPPYLVPLGPFAGPFLCDSTWRRGWVTWSDKPVAQSLGSCWMIDSLPPLFFQKLLNELKRNINKKQPPMELPGTEVESYETPSCTEAISDPPQAGPPQSKTRHV